MIHELLKEHTVHLHRQLEQLLHTSAFKSNNLSYDNYIHMIITQGSFHSHLEEQLSKQPDVPVWLMQRQQQRADWLRQDAVRLGAEPLSLTLTYSDRYHLIGALYVAEGSMLGARLIASGLRKNDLLQDAPRCFYEQAAQSPASAWRDFLSYLTHESAKRKRQVLAGACLAFQLLIDTARLAHPDAKGQIYSIVSN